MNQLIKINENESGEKIILASELHEWLGVRTKLRHWIDRMLSYGFIEGVDFWSNLTTSEAGRTKIDYVLTLDAAKEISMLQKSEKGKQARRYFIECEKSFKDTLIKQGEMVKVLRDHISQLEAWHRGYVKNVERNKS